MNKLHLTSQETSRYIDTVRDSNDRWFCDCVKGEGRAIAALPELVEALMACCKVAEDIARSPGDEDAEQAATKARAALEKAGF